MLTKSILAVVAIVVISIQFVPVERTNPLGSGGPNVSLELQWVLRRSCYDCHSNETRWPIWAYVAPISWMVVSDVEAARKLLNFSEWATYEPACASPCEAWWVPPLRFTACRPGTTCRSIPTRASASRSLTL